MAGKASWIVTVGLAVLGVALVPLGPTLGLTGEMTGVMVGALVGAAAAMLGAKLERFQANADEDADEAARRNKVKQLISSELVNVALGLLDAHRVLDAAVKQIAASGGPVPGADLSPTIRAMPFTDDLGTDLLVLSEREIDVLSTLRSNTALTRKAMQDIADPEGSFGPLTMTRLKNSLAHDMKVLAEAFDEFSPKHRLRLPGKEPEQTSSILRRCADS